MRDFVAIPDRIVYEAALQVATVFRHSNWRLPLAVERALNWVVVTPRMHGIHHSILKDEANSNYSVIFRRWDWLHGTLKLNIPQAEVVIGVPAYLDRASNRLLALLALPFRKQKDYWHVPEGTTKATRSRSRGKNVLLPDRPP